MANTNGSRRPSAVVERDHKVASTLVQEGKPLATVADELGLSDKHNLVYGSLWRLRKAGHVEKVRVGSRTPVWQLTDSGRAFAQSAPAPVVVQTEPEAQASQPQEAPQAEAPAEAPAPAAVPQF